MSKIVVSEYVSVDGVMQAPGYAEEDREGGFQHGGWVVDLSSPEQEAWVLEQAQAADALLLGRITYEIWADAWPNRRGPFAEKFNAMPKYVVSKTLKNPEWSNSTVLSGDVVEEIEKLKGEGDQTIMVNGSSRLVHTLLENDLADRCTLMYFPVILGSGKRVFPERVEKTRLTLADTTAFDSGVVVHTYDLTQ